VDFEATWGNYYEKYREALGSADGKAMMQKNNEAW